MIRSETVQLYNWIDIQLGICRVMGIEPAQFRRYHEVVGGSYRDLWYVALDTVVPRQMANETILYLYSLDDPSPHIEMQGEWAQPFFDAYNKVFRELDPDRHGVLVKFSWFIW